MVTVAFRLRCINVDVVYIPVLYITSIPNILLEVRAFNKYFIITIRSFIGLYTDMLETLGTERGGPGED